MKIRAFVVIVIVCAVAGNIAFRTNGQEPSGGTPSAANADQNGEQRPNQTQVQLVSVDSHYDQSISRETGDEWLAWDAENSLLTECRIKWKADRDYDSDYKAATVDLPFEPMLLVRGGGLTSGPITTLYKSNWDQPLNEKTPLEFTLREAKYELKIVKSEDTAKCEYDGLPMNARLLLTSGESRQVLYSLVDCADGAIWYVAWAGDLDRDGKLDLLLSLGQSDMGGSQRLFLSSKASKGRLVKEVAELIEDGC